MTPRRVLIASEPMEYGVLAYLERLFDGLDRRRWEPALAFSTGRMAPQAETLVQRLARDGIRVCRLPFRRGLGPGDAVGAVGLAAEIRAFRPALLHLHSTKAGLIGRTLARRFRVPVAYTPHGTSWQYTGTITGRVQLALERALRRATDLLVAVCAEEARAFVAEVGFAADRVRVVRNGVRCPEPSEVAAARVRTRAELGIAGDQPWAVFVGRLTPEKGADVLLRALERDVGLAGVVVVGDGPERPALARAAAALPVEVRFVGYRHDVTPFLAAADLLVQPSRSEGLPFALLEAMAHGLPAVTSAVGGVAAAVDGGGLVVPPEDVGALREALAALARDPGRRRALGEAGRARVARHFDCRTMVSALHAAYEETAARGVRRGEA